MVEGEECCICGGKSGFANLLAVFAEVGKHVNKQGITDKAYPPFQKWYFYPRHDGNPSCRGKKAEEKKGQRAALV